MVSVRPICGSQWRRPVGSQSNMLYICGGVTHNIHCGVYKFVWGCICIESALGRIIIKLMRVHCDYLTMYIGGGNVRVYIRVKVG